jgi:cyclohexanecarboxylate-CoA ligase
VTAGEFPGRLLRAGSLTELLAKRTAASGDAPMLIDACGLRLSFGEFSDHCERTAVALSAQGVGHGTRVAWQLPTRISTVIVMAALARLGAVQAPVIPIYRSRETGAVVAAAAAVASLPPPPAASEWVYFTSGPSGLPKGARHTDAPLLAAAHGWTLQGRVGELDGDVGSMAFPVAHVGGIIYVMSQLISGFPIVLAEGFDAATIDLFPRHSVTMSGGSAVFYTALLAAQREFAAASRALRDKFSGA